VNTNAKKVLVVDDEEIVRYSLKNILTSNGFAVDDVPSGEEALKKIYETNYHLVLSDLVLEGMGGLELLENIKVISPRTLVILITGYGSVKTAVDALRLGVYDYLLKPCDENELLLRVRRALEMQAYGSEQKRLHELNAIAKTSVTLSDRINTPLNIILGNIEILQLIPDLENQTKIQETLKVMETQIFRIKKVMDRLAKLTNAETRRYPALRDFEIIDLTNEDGDD
jgi:YesN/AraC family two-component response regulator